MGLENRSYYRDDQQYSAFGGGTYGGVTRSMVVTIILINVAIFVLDMFTARMGPNGPNWLSWFMSLKVDGEGFMATAGVPFWQLPPFNIWQVVTYGFAHSSVSEPGGIWHIGMNMLMLFFLGRPVEQRYGSQEFLKFYMFAPVFAGVVSYIYNLLSGLSVHLVGASGAVAAVAILFVLSFPKQTLLIWGVLPIPAWLFGLLFVSLDIVTAFKTDSRIGWYAHLSGALFAFLYFRLHWNFGGLTFDWLKRSFKSKPNLRVHKPDADSRLQNQADEILQKIADYGEGSLTNKERKILNKYSKSVRSKRK